MSDQHVIDIVLVTGMAGAGRASALHILEDLGYEAIDNLPLVFLPALLDGLANKPQAKPLAIGIDSRTRGFSVSEVAAVMEGLKKDGRFTLSLLFLECDDEVLRRRFTETRRRHPLALDRPVADGIAAERLLMGTIKSIADLCIDTSDLTLARLKTLLEQHYAGKQQKRPVISVVSFSYRFGLPREADLVFDVRFLKNPYYHPTLKPLTGKDDAVAAYIAEDTETEPFLTNLTTLLQPLIPRYEAEGKNYLTLAIGCTGGKHRSVYIARRLAEWLAGSGLHVQLSHRDIDKENRETSNT